MLEIVPIRAPTLHSTFKPSNQSAQRFTMYIHVCLLQQSTTIQVTVSSKQNYLSSGGKSSLRLSTLPARPLSGNKKGRKRRTAVRFAYTLIQPWSLGLACKCVAIFRPVSPLYNTFVRWILCRWTRGSTQVCACCARVCPRQPAPICTRACIATARPAKPVNHAARQHQHHTGTPTPTPNGAFSYRRDRNTVPLSLVLYPSASRLLPLHDDAGLREMQSGLIQRLHTHRPRGTIARYCAGIFVVVECFWGCFRCLGAKRMVGDTRWSIFPAVLFILAPFNFRPG